MTTESSKRQHLASFLALHHDIPIERAMEFVELPDVDDYTEYNFVSTGAFRIGLDEVQGEFSLEFRAREQHLKDLCTAYCHNIKTPESFEGYLDLIQVTDEKRHERKYKDTDEPYRWYTPEQLSEVVEELTECVEWLQAHIYEEDNVPEMYQYIYDLNLAILLYGLDQSADQEWLSVDFKNGYYTFRSRPHSRGFITKDLDERFLSELGGRLQNIFGERDATPDGSELDGLIDETVEELLPYYDGPTRKLAMLTEQAYTFHLEEV